MIDNFIEIISKVNWEIKYSVNHIINRLNSQGIIWQNNIIGTDNFLNVTRLIGEKVQQQIEK